MKHATTWMNLDSIMLNEKCQSQRPNTVWVHLCEMSRNGKLKETESSIISFPGRGEEMGRDWVSEGPSFAFKVTECSKIRLWWWLYKSGSVLNLTELYT